MNLVIEIQPEIFSDIGWGRRSFRATPYLVALPTTRRRRRDTRLDRYVSFQLNLPFNFTRESPRQRRERIMTTREELERQRIADDAWAEQQEACRLHKMHDDTLRFVRAACRMFPAGSTKGEEISLWRDRPGPPLPFNPFRCMLTQAALNFPGHEARIVCANGHVISDPIKVSLIGDHGKIGTPREDDGMIGWYRAGAAHARMEADFLPSSCFSLRL